MIHVALEAEAELRPALERLGLLGRAEPVRFAPLTGGVASDIWLVEAGSEGARRFVVKRALEKLKVAADWRVPVARNAAEAEWLRVAGAIAPGSAPKVLAHDPEAGLFAMTYLPRETHPVWKERLRAGEADPAFAAAIGRTITRIHAATAGDEAIARRFANDDLFHAIRLEPYLEATAARHPDLAAPLLGLSSSTLRAHLALGHGDVSPKNILVGPGRQPVFLDAECAWYGDPAFDLAFCLNHLLLKCLWVPQAAAGFLACFAALARAYLAGVSWEGPAELEARAARLLPALLLARVDGKSPVEYVTDERDKQAVRDFARPRIRVPDQQLAPIRDGWAARLGLSRRA
jgi:aminoglycoside phosphotransferase (APT) family kinase protein